MQEPLTSTCVYMTMICNLHTNVWWPFCPPADTLEQVNAEIEAQSPSKIFAVVHISKVNPYI